MDLITWLTLSHNLPFVFALMLGTLFSVLQLFFGFIPDGIDVDVDLDVDMDVDGAIDFDVDVDGNAPPIITHFLSWLGVGKAPLTVLALTFLITFGVLGLGVSYALSFVFAVPLVGSWLAWGWVGAIALVSGRLTGLAARFINSVLPQEQTHASGGAGHMQKIGKATTDIDAAGGQVIVDNEYLFCFSASPNIIPKGSQILVIGYDPERLSYQVEPIQG